MELLQPGNEVPAFELQNEKGETITKEDLLGKKYILFFYPKDDTPTCTKVACNLRDNYDYYKSQGYELYGVSPDTVAKHQKFINKYDFPFSLLADPEKKLLNAFGAFGPKKFMGRMIEGVYRSTYVINEKGIIEALIDKVKSKIHTEQLKEVIN